MIFLLPKNYVEKGFQWFLVKLGSNRFWWTFYWKCAYRFNKIA